jgi:hypothetical protein
MLYYSNGGPGPASKLLRVDAPQGGAPRRLVSSTGPRSERFVVDGNETPTPS